MPLLRLLSSYHRHERVYRIKMLPEALPSYLQHPEGSEFAELYRRINENDLGDPELTSLFNEDWDRFIHFLKNE